MSDVDNIVVTRGDVVFYGAAPGSHGHQECGEEQRLSGQYIRYGHTAQNNKEWNILSGPNPRLSLLSSEFMISMPFKAF